MKKNKNVFIMCIIIKTSIRKRRLEGKTVLLSDLSGVYLSEKQELSPPEGGSYVVTGDDEPQQRAWRTSGPQPGAPGWAAEKRGRYRYQHRAEEADPDLLVEEEDENSTRTVVKLRGRLAPVKILSVDLMLRSHFWTGCRSRLLHL